MERAGKEVNNSVVSSILEHAVPKTTLHDHVSGKVLFGVTLRAPQYLDAEQEDELFQFLSIQATKVRAIVSAYNGEKDGC